MVEKRGNLFSYIGRVDAVCITTNGFVKSNGEAVMGRGVAYQAKQRYVDLPMLLGTELENRGNLVHKLKCVEGDTWLLSLPVKHKWMEEADLTLIEQSLITLEALTTCESWKSVVLPRPGCGNGNLS